ncbi:MAG: glycine/D-amino acid oxidase-like deaminating enzyme [Gammaproteobacteria bacterium]|jgi:glycine/D-amino acid oxidase-like deaminating enzyme
MSNKYLFDQSLYQFDQRQPSYWEATAGDVKPEGRTLSGTEHCDVAIIGGGYTGVSAALHLARDHSMDARVLEAGHIGWGASGRNGGFCTMGSTKVSLKSQITRYGLEQTRHFYRSQSDAVELVRELGETESINFMPQGNCEYVVADNPKGFQELIELAKFQTKKLNIETEILTPAEFSEVGYSSHHQHGAMVIRPSFGLHPMRYILGLACAAEKHGAHLYPSSEVLSWHKSGSKHYLKTLNGELIADRVILTGNGFMPEHINPEIRGRPLPLQSAIVVTRPLSSDEIATQGWKTHAPTVNSARMFFYYRLLPDNRLLLGGRANTKGDQKGAEHTWQWLKQSISKRWPALSNVEYDYQWRGLVCFTMNLRPSLGQFPDDSSAWFSFGYHGNGVASSTWHGRELARLIATTGLEQTGSKSELPALIQGLPPRFPFANLRRKYLAMALSVYKLGDRFGF